MRLQRMKDTGALPASTAEAPSGDAALLSQETMPGNGASRKRSRDASPDDSRKKTKPGVPEGFFDSGFEQSSVDSAPEAPLDENTQGTSDQVELVSRPATPLKTAGVPAQAPVPTADVDEDEWAAFEADIAQAEQEVISAEDAIISAPAMTAEEIAAQAREEASAQRKERLEAEMEGEREDAERKLVEEFEEMEALEERVRKLKEKREALRAREFRLVDKPTVTVAKAEPNGAAAEDEDEDDDDDDDDLDDWNTFPMR